MEINQADHNMAIKDEPEQSGIVYYDAKDSTLFGLYGIDDKKEKGYPRFNAKERELISKASKDVEFLSYHSAGIQLKFETDSSQIYFRATNQNPSNMDNLSNIAQSGIALYSFDEKENRYFLQGVTRFSPKASSYNVPMLNFPQGHRKNRKYVAYLPSYMGVVSLEVGLEKGAKVKPVGFAHPQRIGIYGTSITQGCATSQPGENYTNMISRSLDLEVLNFGFSGSAMMEPETATILSQRNLDLLLIDAEPNAGMDWKLKERLEPFLDIYFEKCPKTPVILASRTYLGMDFYEQEDVIERREFYRGFLKKECEKYAEKGYRISFIDGLKIVPIDKAEFSIDGLHPDSYALALIAEAYIKKIKEYL